MECNAQLGEGRPLRHRLQIVQRLGGLHLDDPGQSLAPPAGVQHQIRIPGGRGGPDRRRALVTRIDGNVALPLVLRLEQANYPIVLELLAHGPHEDGTQLTSDAGTGLKTLAAGVPDGRSRFVGARRQKRQNIARKHLNNLFDRSVHLTHLQGGRDNGPVSPPDTVAPPARVLIVADDLSVTELFSRILRLDGFEVWAAGSANEGLDLATIHRPHAVILDLRMPLSRGLVALRALRALPGLRETPITIVTGDYYPADAQAHEVRALGAEIRFKPLWLDELVTLAREMLQTPVRD